MTAWFATVAIPGGIVRRSSGFSRDNRDGSDTRVTAEAAHTKIAQRSSIS